MMAYGSDVTLGSLTGVRGEGDAIRCSDAWDGAMYLNDD